MLNYKGVEGGECTRDLKEMIRVGAEAEKNIKRVTLHLMTSLFNLNIKVSESRQETCLRQKKILKESKRVRL